jgi:putative ABC transport system permease protein
MSPLAVAATALAAVSANKLRSLLTLLGIVIGVAAVISLMAIGRGTQARITANIEALGTNLLFVQPGATRQQGIAGALGSAATLTLDDAFALVDPLFAPSVATVAPELRTTGRIVANRKNVQTQMVGVTPEYESVRNFPVRYGRFISAADAAGSSAVVVLGSRVSETLFGARDPVGQPVRINGRQFEVVGVLKSKGGGAQAFTDNQALVPITTAYYRLSSQRTAQGGVSVQSINVQVRNNDQMDAAVTEISTLLRLRHRITAGDHRHPPTDDRDLRRLSRGDRRDLPAGGRNRDHEHHARLGHRENARDRHSQGDGCQATGRAGPVPDRGIAPQPYRGGCRRRGRRGPDDPAERPQPGQSDVYDRVQQ